MDFSGCIALRSVEISISNDNNSGLQSIESFAFNNCSNLMNIAVPSFCNVGSRAFRGCQHTVFDSDDDFEIPDNILRMRLKCTRFDDLPYHKVCYQQGHVGIPTNFTTLTNNDESYKNKGMFGLTPFHILALSAKPSVEALQKLLEATSPNGILVLDKSGATPLRYAVESFAPNTIVFLKALLHTMADKRTQSLGLDSWKSQIMEKIFSFHENEISERTKRIHKIVALLRLYERKEALSLLELAVWKCKMEANKGVERASKQTKVEGDARHRAYLNSGAGTVIINILPYLGDVVKTLTNFLILALDSLEKQRSTLGTISGIYIA